VSGRAAGNVSEAATFGPNKQLNFLVGNAVAAGASGTASLNEAISFGVGNAVAAGSTFALSQYGLRVTWAEVAYQANTNVTVPFGVGNAVAGGGGAAAVNVSLAGSVGNAVAAGNTVAFDDATTFTVGNAVAAGSTAGITVYGGVRVTWAEAQYQASPNVTIPLGIGNAVAAGATAGVAVYGAVRITWAEAQYQSSGGDTVGFTVGNAVAGGPAGATVSEDITLGFTTGNAVAGGPSGATVSVDLTLDCGTGNAVAEGQTCLLPALTVAPSATPGYAPKTRYRVRVGSRWMEVDPLDPMSVRRAYDAAQEDAQDAATQDVEAPAAVAAQAVVVQPIKGPDYAGLAKEARRISEDIRKVYADALQTALIARLMREQIERDDEDDIAVLLASI
jgi:hypothetical protein